MTHTVVVYLKSGGGVGLTGHLDTQTQVRSGVTQYYHNTALELFHHSALRSVIS